MNKTYDIAIIGAGITGSAIFYLASKYLKNIGRIALLEKYDSPAQVNSSSFMNSQTLHFGDIETNYNPERAAKLKMAADMVKSYVTKKGDPHLFRQYQKMVLGVGIDECLLLHKRYNDLTSLFPELSFIGRKDLATFEPEVVKGRDSSETIAALYTKDGFAVDFGRLSNEFIKDALKSGVSIDATFGTKVKSIAKNDNYMITHDKGTLEAKVLIAASGAHSLLFAKNLGYGDEYIVLPVAGNFYATRKRLRGKVYTVQNDKLPFAAIHGDPDLNNPDITRFGPTANVLPMLERGNYSTLLDFLNIVRSSPGALASMMKILSDKVLRDYMLENVVYDIPMIGSGAFLKKAQKIIPSLEEKDLLPDKIYGGIRPQLVNTKSGEIFKGDAKIITDRPGDRAIFNITPSPGATDCLENAEQNVRQAAIFLGKEFDEERMNEDFK
jgi:malate dehydrogenase (quinone)